jgi:integrase
MALDLGPGADGKRIRRWHSGFATKDLAEKARVRLLAQIDSGGYVDPSRITTGAYLEQWLDHVKRVRAAATHERYTYCLNRYVIPHVGTLRFQSLSPLHLQQLYDLLAERGGQDGAPLSAGTCALVHRVLRRAMQQAIRWQLRPTNPCDAVDPPMPPRGRPVVLEPAQTRALLDGARQAGGWLWVFVALGTTLGLRRGELLALRWSDVDLDRGTITVRRSLGLVGGKLTYSPPKTQAGERELVLAPFILTALRRHRAEQAERRLAFGSAYDTAGDLVLCREDGSPLRPDAAGHRFKKLIRSIGLPESIHVHSLRHGFASLLAEAGEGPAAIAKVLGHNDGGQLALRVYVRPAETAATPRRRQGRAAARRRGLGRVAIGLQPTRNRPVDLG